MYLQHHGAADTWLSSLITELPQFYVNQPVHLPVLQQTVLPTGRPLDQYFLTIT